MGGQSNRKCAEDTLLKWFIRLALSAVHVLREAIWPHVAFILECLASWELYDHDL